MAYHLPCHHMGTLQVFFVFFFRWRYRWLTGSEAARQDSKQRETTCREDGRTGSQLRGKYLTLAGCLDPACSLVMTNQSKKKKKTWQGRAE